MSASPSSTWRPHRMARGSRVKFWSRRISTSSSVRPSAQRSPYRRQRRRSTARSNSHTFHPVSTSGSTRRTWARNSARSARSSGKTSAPETGAQRRYVGRPPDLDAHHGLAGEGDEVGGNDAGGSRQARRPTRVGRANEEVGRLAVIDDQRRLAALEDAVQVHLGTARDDAVGGRQDEAALGHAAILPRASGGSQGLAW